MSAAALHLRDSMNHMDRITDDIWIGSSTDAKDRDSLRRKGIRSILCLDGCLLGVKGLSTPGYWPRFARET